MPKRVIPQARIEKLIRNVVVFGSVNERRRFAENLCNEFRKAHPFLDAYWKDVEATTSSRLFSICPTKPST